MHRKKKCIELENYLNCFENFFFTHKISINKSLTINKRQLEKNIFVIFKYIEVFFFYKISNKTTSWAWHYLTYSIKILKTLISTKSIIVDIFKWILHANKTPSNRKNKIQTKKTKIEM